MNASLEYQYREADALHARLTIVEAEIAHLQGENMMLNESFETVQHRVSDIQSQIEHEER